MKANRTELHTYKAMNDKIAELTSTLEKSDYFPGPGDLEKEGFELHSVYRLEVPEDVVERNVAVFENKEGERIVLHEVFHDKEGGMFQNAAFAEKERVLKWLQPAINRSLQFPDQFLVETVLSKNFPKDGDNPYRDSRNSYGCAHYKWILEDKEKQLRVLKSYLENKDEGNLIGREKEIYRAAKELYSQLISKE